jgi:hypothetical protein
MGHSAHHGSRNRVNDFVALMDDPRRETFPRRECVFFTCAVMGRRWIGIGASYNALTESGLLLRAGFLRAHVPSSEPRNPVRGPA